MLSKRKRRRTIIAADQLLKLERLYKQEQWPGREKKEALAKEIGMSTHFVNIWFQNKRSRMKKLAQEEEELSALKTLRKQGDEEQEAPKPFKLVQIAPKPPPPVPQIPPDSRFSHLHSTNQDLFEMKSLAKQSTPTNTTSTTTTCSAACSKHNPASSYQVPSYHQQGKPFIISNATAPVHDPRSTITSCGATSSQNQPVASGDGRNIFQWMVAMAAVIEGGIISTEDPNFGKSVNAALYGIKLQDNEDLLVYDKVDGFQVRMADNDSDNESDSDDITL